MRAPGRLAAALGRVVSPAGLAVLYACQGLVAVLLLAMLVPPLENSDEFNHARRVDQISSGVLVATRYAGPESSGGRVDTGIERVDEAIGGVRFHPERRISAAALAAAGRIRWGAHALRNFANTAIYPPFLYLPAVAAERLGRALGLSVLHTLALERVASGIAALAIAAAAIAASGADAPFLFVLLSLPMVLSLFASISQDGLMIALAAASGVLARRAARPRAFAALCAAFALELAARPAYLPLVGLVLLLPRLALRRRLVGFGAIAFVALAWSAIAAACTMIPQRPGWMIDPGRQLERLLERPVRVWELACATFAGPQGMEGLSYYKEAVGVLGWIDVVLPAAFYALAGVMLGLSLVALLPGRTAILRPPAAGVAALLVAAAAGGVFLLEYLTWTPLGWPIVAGVQGRYFLPIFACLPWLLPGVRWRLPEGAAIALRLPLLVFPALSIAVSAVAIVRRYDLP